MAQPVGWCWALFENWARSIAVETAGYWVILKIWLLFSSLHGNWAKLKTWPRPGMLSTLKLVLLLFGNFSRCCILSVLEISLFSTGNFLKYYCSLFYFFFFFFFCCFLFQLTQTSVIVNFRVCSRLSVPEWLQPANFFAYIARVETAICHLWACHLLPLNPSLNKCGCLSACNQNKDKIQVLSAVETHSTKYPSQVWVLLYLLLCK